MAALKALSNHVTARAAGCPKDEEPHVRFSARDRDRGEPARFVSAPNFLIGPPRIYAARFR
jgi:hypothetical protein